MNPRGHWPASFTPLEPVTSGCQVRLGRNSWDNGIGGLHDEITVECVTHGRLGSFRPGAHAVDDARRIFREHISA